MHFGARWSNLRVRKHTRCFALIAMLKSSEREFVSVVIDTSQVSRTVNPWRWRWRWRLAFHLAKFRTTSDHDDQFMVSSSGAASESERFKSAFKVARKNRNQPMGELANFTVNSRMAIMPHPPPARFINLLIGL